MGIGHEGRTDFKEWEVLSSSLPSPSVDKVLSLELCELVRLTSGFIHYVASRRRFRSVSEPRRISLIRCPLRAEAQSGRCAGSLGLICSTTRGTL